MTAHLYDPLDSKYFDSVEARAERDRTFQTCSDCRICIRSCESFKSLFRMIDERDGATDVRVLTDDQHRHVVDTCYQCKLCFVVCPYTPGNEQTWVVDFPRLMLRSLAIQGREGKVPRSARLLARTDLQGETATKVAPLANTVMKWRPARLVMEKATGIAAARLVPSYARQRFSTWFRNRTTRHGAAADGESTVALFATCLVEYQATEVGQDLVGVFEHNGIRCELPPGQRCCGMPWLDAEDVKNFEEQARRNVEVLAPAVRACADVVVPQPTCAYVLPSTLRSTSWSGTPTASSSPGFRARRTTRSRGTRRVTTAPSSWGRGAASSWSSRGRGCGPWSASAIDGTWGLRAENVEIAKRTARPLMDAIKNSRAPVVAGDCHLANTAIREETGKVPVHPVQVLARAYGLPEP
ncbi:MAG: hypothetical protein E6G60_01790 [Actinobacteria bacterium]|nr:MAG: hypothetical protein E6G60_01790 [Actinomycetota bacterium]